MPWCSLFHFRNAWPVIVHGLALWWQPCWSRCSTPPLRSTSQPALKRDAAAPSRERAGMSPPAHLPSAGGPSGADTTLGQDVLSKAASPGALKLISTKMLQPRELTAATSCSTGGPSGLAAEQAIQCDAPGCDVSKPPARLDATGNGGGQHPP